MSRCADQTGIPSITRRQALGAIAGGALAATLGQRSNVHAANNIMFPEPQFVQTNGIRMAVYEEGEGVPVVLCHGFPELAYSWRHQLPALARAGFHAIAPDQRGYGKTDRPEKIEAYNIQELCKDMVGLLDAKKIDKAVFCGHDWGGAIVWMMPLLHPDRVLGVIGVNTPLNKPDLAVQEPPLKRMRDALGDDNYVVSFQQPGRADKVLARDVRKTFTFFMRRGGLMNVQYYARLPADSPERNFEILNLLDAPEGTFTGELFLSRAELDVFVNTYKQTGFTGGINWYRNIDRNWELTKGLTYKITVPGLYVGADNDVVLPPSSADNMDQIVADLEKHTITDCGHWTQQEQPQDFNRVIIGWLNRKFRK